MRCWRWKAYKEEVVFRSEQSEILLALSPRHIPGQRGLLLVRNPVRIYIVYM